MKHIFSAFICFFALTGFTDLTQDASNLKVESKTPEWEVVSETQSVIKAFNPQYNLQFTFNVAPFLPDSPQCRNFKRIKDIKYRINIYKVASAQDTNWTRSFSQMRITFSGNGIVQETRVYGSNLIKDNYKAKTGSTVNVGTLDFLAPIVCKDINNTTVHVSGMKSGKQTIPPLTFKITYQE